MPSPPKMKRNIKMNAFPATVFLYPTLYPIIAGKMKTIIVPQKEPANDTKSVIKAKLLTTKALRNRIRRARMICQNKFIGSPVILKIFAFKE